MSWRTVVVTGVAKLDYRLNFMVVRKINQTIQVNIDEIAMLIIESTAVSLTSTLVCELIKSKVKVIFCDEKHNPSSELIPYYGSHDTSAKVRNQIKWDPSIKNIVWTEIITEKIRQQRLHLKEHGLNQQAEMLMDYALSVTAGDETNREGHAAKVYFNALFGMDFTRTDDNPINAALNYGYGVILACFNREIVSNGYITQLGLFHDNMFNNFNLASDLMEPFRILVDRKVCKMDPTVLGADDKHEIVGMLNEMVLIDSRYNTISNAIKIYCRSVFDALNENDVSLIRFYKYEL